MARCPKFTTFIHNTLIENSITMNKKMILLGAVALVGCFVFASFDKITLAQQKEQIALSVTSQLEAFRTEKENACTELVNVEASTRFNAWVEAEAAKPAVGGKKKTYVKKTVPSGPKVDPLPQTPPPPPVVDPKKSKMEGGTKVEEKKSKMEGEPANNVEKKKSKMGGGGN